MGDHERDRYVQYLFMDLLIHSASPPEDGSDRLSSPVSILAMDFVGNIRFWLRFARDHSSE